MNHVSFDPWVGKDFQTGGVFRKKIMALGESFYCSDEEAVNGLTTTVVSDYLNSRKGVITPTQGGWCNTYLKFERALVNFETSPEDSIRIWDSILFYNYLQIPMDGTRKTGTWKDFENAEIPFFEVLEKYAPDCIIVWGMRLYSMLPDTCWKESLDEKLDDGYILRKGIYKLSSGKEIKTVAIYHPSVGFSWDYWHNSIAPFLGLSAKF